MKKVKQVLAITGVVLLAALYVSTLIFALIGSDFATGCFKAAIYATVVVPVLIWAYTLIYRLLKNHYSLRDDFDPAEKEELNKEEQKTENSSSQKEDCE